MCCYWNQRCPKRTNTSGAYVTKIHDEIEHFQLEHEIIHMIRQQIGAVASLRNVVIVNRLPKLVQVKFFEN
jgi:acyl-coenzyme A synthetase/AMP-(fatty) acid ligase